MADSLDIARILQGFPDVNQAMPEAYADPNRGVGPAILSMAHSLMSLPQRAIDASASDVQNLGDHSQPLQSAGPALEAALMTMGGGAIAGVPVRAGEAVLGAGPIRAYHGSPHDFDKFDLSKIGTGEGAQAYGHGLYFAENEGVAKAYRDALAPRGGFNDIADALVKQSGGDWKKAADRFSTDMAKRQQWAESQGLKYQSPQYDLNTLATLQRGHPGRMYEVNINADPVHFLDWNKPLIEQGAVGKRAFESIHDQPLLPPTVPSGAPDAGQWVRRMQGLTPSGPISGYHGPREFTSQLNEAGIPGIKYLDQGSRAAGDGSRNYVVFNHDLIDIVKKYGLAGMPAGLMGMGLAGEDKQ